MRVFGKKYGEEKVLCPFHDEKTPSCVITEERFHCFGCGESGTRSVYDERMAQYQKAADELVRRALIRSN